MKKRTLCGARAFLCLLIATSTTLLIAQSATTDVPHIVKFSGLAPVGATTAIFAIYDREDATGPLWSETQIVSTDNAGRYSVLLGSNTAEGIPTSIFASGDARWVGVKFGDSPEAARVLMVSVPYALKAADADSLGGKPMSAFLLADQSMESSSVNTPTARIHRLNAGTTSSGLPITNATGDSGAQNFLAKFLADGVTLVDSTVFETGGNVGIGTTTPLATLDIASPSAVVSIGTNFSGTSQLAKEFTTPHSAANVPSQIGLGLSDGAFTGMNVKDFRDGSFNSAAIEFATHHGGVSAGTRMILDKDGKLGLGTTTPGALFELGTAGGDIAFGTNFSGASQIIKAFTTPHSAGNVPSQINLGLLDSVFTGLSIKDVRDGTFNSASIEFSTHHGGVSAGTRMVLDKDGRLGLGTAFPATLLDVEGDVGVGNNLAAQNQVGKIFSVAHSPSNVPAQINFGLVDSLFTGVSVKDVRDGNFNSASIEFVTHHGGVSVGTRMLIDKDGNVGIANAAPVAKMDVIQAAAGASNFSVGTAPPSAVHGDTTSTSGVIAGILGTTSSVDGYGVLGENLASGTGNGISAGVRGITANVDVSTPTTLGTGVWGEALQSYGDNVGVFGRSASDSGTGVEGQALSVTGDAAGVYGISASNAGTGVWGEVTATSSQSSSSFPAGVYGRAAGSGAVAGLFDSNSPATNILVGRQGTTNVFRVNGSGAVFGTGSFNTGGADFAESVDVEKRSEFESGDVIAIDTAGVRRFHKASQPYSTLVAGVFSTKPGIIASPHPMDEDLKAAREIPLAVIGIVPCKANDENGEIRPGDLLVSSSTPGYAMKGTDRNRMTGAIVGKALQPLIGKQGMIEILVSLQ